MGAQSGAHHDFPVTGRRPGDQQPRHVRTHDEENDADGRQKEHEHGTHVTYDLLLHRTNVDTPSFDGVRVGGCERGLNHLEFRLYLFQARSGNQPRGSSEAPPIPVLRRGRIPRQRSPDLRAVQLRDQGVGREHPDDRVLLSVERQSPSDDVAVAAHL